jgi:hypothetical protein
MYNLSMQSKLKPLKIIIWCYFLLLIFEGALRKWVSPGLATPLLLVRDPLALLLIYKATKVGISWMNNYIRIGWFVTALSFSLTLSFIGHQNIFVAIYGARIMFLHFPLIFIIAKVMDKEDVLKIGRVFLLICIPMTLLIALQFYSPQSAWVNRGIGGDMTGSGFSGAMGYFRPSGTFSFTSGLTQYYGFCACFIFYFALSKEKCPKWLLLGSSIGLLMAMPLSISRGLILGVIMTGFFALTASFRFPKIGFSIMKAAFGIVLLISILQTVSTFRTATEVMTSRFDIAGAQEGGLLEGTIGTRALEGFLGPILGSAKQPILSGKLGMGSNVGARLMGAKGYLIAEGEWGRLMGERGVILGLLTIALRVILIVFLTFKSWSFLKQRELLPWLILSFAFISVMQGQWAQTYSLGFGVICTGLLMASMNTKINK